MPGRKSPFIIGSCILSGILLWLSWPERGFTPLIFVAFVPLFFAEHSFYYINKRRNTGRMYVNFFITFFIWNALTTWWIYNATSVGSILAIIANSLLMTTVWQLYYLVKRSQGPVVGY